MNKVMAIFIFSLALISVLSPILILVVSNLNRARGEKKKRKPKQPFVNSVDDDPPTDLATQAKSLDDLIDALSDAHHRNLLRFEEVVEEDDLLNREIKK